MKNSTHYRKFLVLLCALIAISSQAEIYRWVDENGQVHYGDKPGGADHEVIKQQEDDFSTIGIPQKKDNEEVTVDENTEVDKSEKDKSSEDEIIETEDKPVTDDDEKLSEHEKQQIKRIQDMEALTEELRIAREKRETKREKEKEELKALRAGCKKAHERIDTLQKQINQYIVSRSHRGSGRRPEDVTLDTNRQRMNAELKSRQEYVRENCNNL